MNPSLPQDPAADEASRQARIDHLTEQQNLYQYDYEYLPKLALLKTVPADEKFSPEYIAERLLATAKVVPNNLATKAKSFFDPLDELQDYEDFFTLIDLPKVSKVYQTNDSFAEQRLSGVNPLVLQLLKADDSRAEVLKKIASYSKNFEPLFNIPEELANENIYIADYTGTDPTYRGPSFVQGGSQENGRKYLPKPLAFFWWKSVGVSDRGKLVPIAIQIDASESPDIYIPSDGRVYTPFEINPLDWLFAKICVQIADVNHHEMSTHLARTHLVMEPIAISTARQLAKNHPLNILIRVHMRFMLGNNNLAHSTLLAADGPVDKLLSGTFAESMEILTDAYDRWDIKSFAFPEEIKNRGLNDTNRLPHYPYRDDGQLLWDVIHDFVTKYLSHFYPNSKTVKDDPELQAWAKELEDREQGGKVKGMPDHFDTVAELIEIVTTIIFICGPQHSAINFAQPDYIAFAANMPFAAYLDIDRVSRELKPTTQEQLMSLLPPFGRTAEQLNIITVLSAYQFDRLGYYNKSFQEIYSQDFEEVFGSPEHSAVVGIIQQFQQDLNMVEQKIDENNRKRVVPYVYMKPSQVLNSISM
jgi:arachidonate 15-lipoxygenase